MPSTQLKLDMKVEETNSVNWVRLVHERAKGSDIKWNVPVASLPEGWEVGDTVTVTGVKKK